MEQETKELFISGGLLSVGTYTRFLFGGRTYSFWQKVALLAFGFCIVFLLHLTKMNPLYQSSISLVAGLLMPNIINAIVKAGNRSEDKAANKVSKEIDKLLD